jgi:hypothetical protein
MVIWIVYTGVPPVATLPVDLVVAVHFLCWIGPVIWSAPSAVVVVIVLLASRPTRSLAFLRIDLPDLRTLDTGHSSRLLSALRFLSARVFFCCCEST